MWCHATLHYASIFCILPNWQRLNSLAGKTRMCLSCQWYRALELDCSRQLVHPPLLATFGQGAYPQATSWRLTNSVETELLYYFMNKFNEIYLLNMLNSHHASTIKSHSHTHVYVRISAVVIPCFLATRLIPYNCFFHLQEHHQRISSAVKLTTIVRLW